MAPKKNTNKGKAPATGVQNSKVTKRAPLQVAPSDRVTRSNKVATTNRLPQSIQNQMLDAISTPAAPIQPSVDPQPAQAPANDQQQSSSKDHTRQPSATPQPQQYTTQKAQKVEKTRSDGSAPPKKTRFLCDVCDGGAYDMSELRRHYKIHPKAKAPTEETNVRKANFLEWLRGEIRGYPPTAKALKDYAEWLVDGSQTSTQADPIQPAPTNPIAPQTTIQEDPRPPPPTSITRAISPPPPPTSPPARKGRAARSAARNAVWVDPETSEQKAIREGSSRKKPYKDLQTAEARKAYFERYGIPIHIDNSDARFERSVEELEVALVERHEDIIKLEFENKRLRERMDECYGYSRRQAEQEREMYALFGVLRGRYEGALEEIERLKREGA